jgi:hypothetical protein
MEVSSVEYVAYIGLDWADREHAWCLQVVGHKDREKGTLPHTQKLLSNGLLFLPRGFRAHKLPLPSSNRGELCCLHSQSMAT